MIRNFQGGMTKKGEGDQRRRKPKRESRCQRNIAGEFLQLRRADQKEDFTEKRNLEKKKSEEH